MTVVAAACGGDDGGDEAAEPGEEAEVADRDAELRYAVTFSLTSFDPHLGTGAGNPMYMRPVYDQLITLAPVEDGGVDLTPQAATSFEFSDDGLSFDVELRDDITFWDGSPLNADVVVANMERAKNHPGSKVASFLGAVESVEAVDDTHVVFHLSEPDPSLPWSLANTQMGFLVNPAAFDTDLANTPAGSGPFRPVSVQPEAEVVYERWDGYWDPDAALVRRLTIATIADANVRFNATRSGEFDIGYMTPPHDAGSEALTAEGFQWTLGLGPVYFGVMLNSASPPLDDVRVRRAISLAINRPEMSEALTDNINPPNYQAFPVGTLGYDPDLDEDPYDPDAARALIQQAGAEGATIRMIQQISSPQDQMAIVVQQALADIGLNVEIEPLSATEARAAWRRGGHHAFVGPVIARPESSFTLEQSYLSLDNPAPPPEELVEMAQAAIALPFGSEEREQAYQEINALLVENPVHVPLAMFSTVHLCQEDVIGCDRLVDIGATDFRGVGIAES